MVDNDNDDKLDNVAKKGETRENRFNDNNINSANMPDDKDKKDEKLKKNANKNMDTGKNVFNDVDAQDHNDANEGDKNIEDGKESPQQAEKKQSYKEDILAADVVAKIEESTEELIYNKREIRVEDEPFSLWTADQYFHSVFSDHNIIVRYFIEVLVSGFMVLSVPTIGSFVFALDEFDFPAFFTAPSEDENQWIGLFRSNLYFTLWYAMDCVFLMLCLDSTVILTKFLYIVNLDKSEFCWSIVQIFNVIKWYLRTSASFFFGFFLANHMFHPYHVQKLAFTPTENSIKALMLWVSVYSGMLFIVKFLVNVLTSDMKRESI